MLHKIFFLKASEPIALEFNAAGFNAVTVEYKVKGIYPASVEWGKDL